eukprot:7482918-Pyramimonas_sp.AAC.1
MRVYMEELSVRVAEGAHLEAISENHSGLIDIMENIQDIPSVAGAIIRCRSVHSLAAATEGVFMRNDMAPEHT